MYLKVERRSKGDAIDAQLSIAEAVWEDRRWSSRQVPQQHQQLERGIEGIDGVAMYGWIFFQVSAPS